ncbi:hypothetical protein L873DRAFT_1856014 [Choiromyces venosus 120613-1]|uniref:Uncharacterized protein n=1 Tax=Choiromyces venosus 120613-1 TaxID=1336337 RepID=A0A3N4J9K4_9PEZI|nr:hypothetical protein L873DRAFT_1856014 [Choiromyces venosus 120613-1]
MDNNKSELRKQKKRDAGRKHVERYRAAHRPIVPVPRATPMTSQERVRNFRIQKCLRKDTLPEIQDPASTVEVALSKSYASKERTRIYRQRIQVRSGYLKRIPCTVSQRRQKTYAKQKQQSLYADVSKYNQGVALDHNSQQNSASDLVLLAQQAELRKEAYRCWPCLVGPVRVMKEEILVLALGRLKRKIKSFQKGSLGVGLGLQLDWNIQVYNFIKLQLKEEKKWKREELNGDPSHPIACKRFRKELALLVVQSGGWGTWVMERILKQEVAYIRYGKLPIPKQGGHVKVASWLTDEGTMLTIRECMSQAGEGMLGFKKYIYVYPTRN